jgi:hypothetical protein
MKQTHGGEIVTSGDGGLAKYDEALRALTAALAEAQHVDEAKNIRSKAVGVAAYARQAKDDALVTTACEIKVRAERKTGELLAAMEKKVGSRGVGKKVESSQSDPTIGLKDLGITKNESSLWQRLAKLPDETFEREVYSAKFDPRHLTTKRILRRAEPRKRKGRGKTPATLQEYKTPEWSFAIASDDLTSFLKVKLGQWPKDRWKDFKNILNSFVSNMQGRIK